MKLVYIVLLSFLVGCMSIPGHYDTYSTADGFDLMRPEGVPEKMPLCSYSELQGEEIILATKSEMKQESYTTDLSISPAEIGYFSLKVEPSVTADHIPYQSYRNKEGKIVAEVDAQEESNYPLSDSYHKIILSNCDIVYINTALSRSEYVEKTIYSEAKNMIGKKIWVDKRKDFRNLQESYHKNANLEHLERVKISDIMLASYVESSNSLSSINIVSPVMLEVVTDDQEEALIPHNTDYYFQNAPLEPEWSNSIVSAIKNQDYRIGMSSRQVMLAVGMPFDINRDVGDWGVHEQWVYNEGGKDFYLYFENGKLTSYQE